MTTNPSFNDKNKQIRKTTAIWRVKLTNPKLIVKNPLQIKRLKNKPILLIDLTLKALRIFLVEIDLSIFIL